MKLAQVMKDLTIAVTISGLLVPGSGIARADESRPAASQHVAPRAPQMVDVSLAEGGVLQGQVVDANGVVQRNVPVTVQQGTQVIARTNTDTNGQFALRGLKGGTYLVSTNGASGVVRAWAPRTAPPSAVTGVLLVPANGAIRAQLGNGGLGQLGVGALLVGALVGTVIYVATDHNNSAS